MQKNETDRHESIRRAQIEFIDRLAEAIVKEIRSETEAAASTSSCAKENKHLEGESLSPAPGILVGPTENPVNSLARRTDLEPS